MKITNVATAVIDGNFPWVLVRVETDAGISGLGEAYWGGGVAEIVHHARPLLLGEDPVNIARLVEIMTRSLSGEGSQGGAGVAAISGIEIALWDLLGRALKTPISTFFGGRFRDKIRIYADCHAGETPDPADYARKAKEVVADGFSAIKFDLDTRNPYTLDISDDPHPRRQWFEPFNRTIGSREMGMDGRRGPRSARWRRPGGDGGDGRALEVRCQRRDQAGPGTGTVRPALAGRSVCRRRISKPSAT